MISINKFFLYLVLVGIICSRVCSVIIEGVIPTPSKEPRTCIITGIEESPNEDPREKVVEFLDEKMVYDIDIDEIVSAKRIGDNSPRDIRVEFDIEFPIKIMERKHYHLNDQNVYRIYSNHSYTRLRIKNSMKPTLSSVQRFLNKPVQLTSTHHPFDDLF